MSACVSIAEALRCTPGFIDLGKEWAFRPSRAERYSQQTDEQRERALDRAEEKRARKRAMRLALARGRG